MKKILLITICFLLTSLGLLGCSNDKDLVDAGEILFLSTVATIEQDADYNKSFTGVGYSKETLEGINESDRKTLFERIAQKYNVSVQQLPEDFIFGKNDLALSIKRSKTSSNKVTVNSTKRMGAGISYTIELVKKEDVWKVDKITKTSSGK
ncbi:hypothetical protein ACI48J_03845 [Paenibacillus chitinolyticus]|uniref:hypothetical protein n=1 Tax=Paenibacillus chitinolyticus TaxID=79263 RepID=UPI003867FCE1